MISDEKLRQLWYETGSGSFDEKDPGKLAVLRRFSHAIIATHEGGGRRIEGFTAEWSNKCGRDFSINRATLESGANALAGEPVRCTLILHDPPQPKEMTLLEAAERLTKLWSDLTPLIPEMRALFDAVARERAKQSPPAPQPKSAEERVREALAHMERFTMVMEGNELCRIVRAILRGERP